MAQKKSCSVSASDKASRMGLGVHAKHAVRNLFSRSDDFDVWSPPRLVRYHTTYVPANVCGMVVPNDLISAVSSNVLHINQDRPVMIMASELDYWTRTHACHICSDGDRDADRICVVCTTDDVRVLEQTVEFTGKYHVLGGLMDAEGQGADKTRLNALLARIKASDVKVKKVILALGRDEKGEAAASFISGLLDKQEISVTRLDHVRQGDVDTTEDDKAPCEICGLLTPAVKRAIDPNRAKIAWCDNTRIEVRVHDSFRIPNERFDEWCQDFNDPPNQGLHEDLLQAIREGDLNVFEIPYTHTGYSPDEKGWMNRWTDNLERTFRDMRSNSRISSDNQGYRSYPGQKLRSFQGFCGFRDPLNRNDPGRLTWFFFGQFMGRDSGDGRRGWIVFVQIGILQALCAAYMAEMLDGTFDAFLKRWGLIIPHECFAREDKEARDERKRQKRDEAKKAKNPETGGGQSKANPPPADAGGGQQDVDADKGKTGTDQAAEPEKPADQAAASGTESDKPADAEALAYESTFGGLDASPGTPPDAPSTLS